MSMENVVARGGTSLGSAFIESGGFSAVRCVGTIGQSVVVQSEEVEAT